VLATERGDLAGVSDSVLDALGRAPQLNEAEHEHLLDLARAATPARHARRWLDWRSCHVILVS
jgi:hypothetical protein